MLTRKSDMGRRVNAIADSCGENESVVIDGNPHGVLLQEIRHADNFLYYTI